MTTIRHYQLFSHQSTQTCLRSPVRWNRNEIKLVFSIFNHKFISWLNIVRIKSLHKFFSRSCKEILPLTRFAIKSSIAFWINPPSPRACPAVNLSVRLPVLLETRAKTVFDFYIVPAIYRVVSACFSLKCYIPFHIANTLKASQLSIGAISALASHSNVSPISNRVLVGVIM